MSHRRFGPCHPSKVAQLVKLTLRGGSATYILTCLMFGEEQDVLVQGKTELSFWKNLILSCQQHAVKFIDIFVHGV